MNLLHMAAEAGIPESRWPYFVAAERAIAAACEGDPGIIANLLPILVVLMRYYDFTLAADVLADRLVAHLDGRITYTVGPAGLRIPEFRCHGEIYLGDNHSTFLAETAVTFIEHHPDAVRSDGDTT